MRHNVGEDQLMPPPSIKGLVRKVTRSQFYKRNIHPRTPAWIRNGFKSVVYHKAEERPPLPDKNVLIDLANSLENDLNRLTALFELPENLWDLEITHDRTGEVNT